MTLTDKAPLVVRVVAITISAIFVAGMGIAVALEGVAGAARYLGAVVIVGFTGVIALLLYFGICNGLIYLSYKIATRKTK